MGMTFGETLGPNIGSDVPDPWWVGQESLEERSSCENHESLHLPLTSALWSLFRQELLLYKTCAQSLTQVALQGDEQPSR